MPSYSIAPGFRFGEPEKDRLAAKARSLEGLGAKANVVPPPFADPLAATGVPLALEALGLLGVLKVSCAIEVDATRCFWGVMGGGRAQEIGAEEID